MDTKIVDLNKHRILKEVSKQTGLDDSNSNISSAFDEAIERGKIYNELANAKARGLIFEGKEPYPCNNMVCKNFKQYNEEEDRYNYCLDSSSHDCLFYMKDPPPNSLDYDDEMLSHKEALDILESLDLVSGEMNRLKEENSKYKSNKASTYEERDQTEVKGITMRQAGDCFYASLDQYITCIKKYENSVLIDDIDISVVARNAGVELEKAMGIYPNIK